MHCRASPVHSIAPVCFILVALAIVIPVFGPGPLSNTVEAQAIVPHITIECVGVTTVVPVGPDQNGLIRLDFLVTVEQHLYQTSTVCLDCTAEGWPTAVVPEELVIQQSDQGNISVFITIPRATSSTLHDAILSGTYTIQPGLFIYVISLTRFSFIVRQYYGITWGTAEGAHELERGQKTDFTIEVRNTGNGDDWFIAEVLNAAALKSSGLEISVPADPIRVTEGSKGQLVMTVKSSESAVEGAHRIQLRCRSDLAEANDGRTVTADLNLTVKITAGFLGLGMGAVFGIDLTFFALGAAIVLAAVYQRGRYGR